jgi:DNA polymerase-3 subunit delta'
LNKSNPNFTLIDIDSDKKMIDINQIRELIKNLNKSSFNTKPRFVLIDNVEYLNINSVNALLKSIEEPSDNVYFILINNYKKVLSTLSSRCINFKIFLSNKEILDTTNKILDDKLELTINRDLINYYSTPGNIYNLVKFAKINEIDLLNLNLQDFLRIIIKENYYKKDNLVRYLIFDLIEFYFIKLSSSFSRKVNDKYMYFLRRISDTKKFNLDEETLFIEFEKEILDG